MLQRTAIAVFAALVLASCGSDGDSSSPADTAPADTEPAAADTEPTATDPVPETTEPAPDTLPETTAAETTVPEPPVVDETTLQELLLDAQPGDVIEIPAGTYSFERSLSLDVDGVTLRGEGSGPDGTILSFANQIAGAEGLLVSASDFTIENLAIEDTIGDALKINEGQNIVVRGVRVEWTGGPSTDNGAYGIYPVQTTNVLIEDSIAIGASDAGIYVGQSNNVIIRDNLAEFNVAGIEIENTNGADVYGNTAVDNTGGILVFNLPGLSQQGSGTRVYANTVNNNNTVNFSEPGTAVSVVPAGSGIIVLSNDRVEIFDNTFVDNGSGHVIVAAGSTVGFTGEGDPDYDFYPEGIHVHDNSYEGGGTNPDSILLALQTILFGDEGGALPQIVWDGVVDEAKLVDGAVAPENRLCVEEQEGVQVVNADAANGFATPTIDVAPFDCTLEPLPAIELAGS